MIDDLYQLEKSSDSLNDAIMELRKLTDTVGSAPGPLAASLRALLSILEGASSLAGALLEMETRR